MTHIPNYYYLTYKRTKRIEGLLWFLCLLFTLILYNVRPMAAYISIIALAVAAVVLWWRQRQ